MRIRDLIDKLDAPPLRWAVFGACFVAILLFYARGISAGDALQWYAVDLTNLYGGSVLDADGYVYPPPLAQLLAPIQGVIPFWFFAAVVLAVNFAVAVHLLGGALLLLMLLGQFEPVTNELLWVPANFLIGAAIWYGLRWPWLFGAVLLTKVTPGIGALWFAARGEWRSFGWAILPAVAVALVSFAFSPRLWSDWVEFAVGGAAQANGNHVVPLVVRLPAAAVLVVWGARRGQPWTVPLAAVLAHTTLAWAIAAPALGYAIGRLGDPRSESGRAMSSLRSLASDRAPTAT